MANSLVPRLFNKESISTKNGAETKGYPDAKE